MVKINYNDGENEFPLQVPTILLFITLGIFRFSILFLFSLALGFHLWWQKHNKEAIQDNDCGSLQRKRTPPCLSWLFCSRWCPRWVQLSRSIRPQSFAIVGSAGLPSLKNPGKYLLFLLYIVSLFQTPLCMSSVEKKKKQHSGSNSAVHTLRTALKTQNEQQKRGVGVGRHQRPDVEPGGVGPGHRDTP